MKIGSYSIHPIETGRFALDGGAMFGVVPYPLWSKSNPPDDRFRIDLAARCLLIQGEGKNILVDNGNGTKFSDKLKDIYKLDTSAVDLHKSLSMHGVSAADITDVILTHVHFDHAGGSTLEKDGALVPTFPNARHYVQRKHWARAVKPGEKDRASFMRDDYLPLQEHGLLEFVDGEGEIFPGIDLMVCNGHTDAQQLPRITGDGKSVLFCCDLFPTTSHVPLPYVMAYDLRPLTTIEEKKRVLPQAYEEEWILFLEHDPKTEAMTVTSSKKGFVVDKTLTID